MDRDTFISRVNQIQFPFEADSYFAFHNAMDSFAKLFEEAKRGGIFFVRIFIEEIRYRIGEQTSKAIQKALDQQRAQLEALHERAFATGDEEYDNFRHRCIAHDWTYDATDDITVWRRGNKVQKELEDIVKEKGGKYQEYWDYAIKHL